jgi:hypothetical protein
MLELLKVQLIECNHETFFDVGRGGMVWSSDPTHLLRALSHTHTVSFLQLAQRFGGAPSPCVPLRCSIVTMAMPTLVRHTCVTLRALCVRSPDTSV